MAEQGFGGLAPYHPSWRERIGNAIYDIARMGGLGSIAHRMRKEGGFAADFVPGLGDALAVDDAKRDYDAGNYGMAATGLGLAALGLVPGLGDVAAKGVKKGIRAFHASPHKFDKFDLSKIGTGEGTQIQGHGFYFGQSPDVADFYSESTVKDLMAREAYAAQPLHRDQLRSVINQIVEIVEEEGIAALDEYAGPRGFEKAWDNAVAAIKRVGGAKGHRYEVNIAAELDDFYDLDRPLNEQPSHIIDAINRTGRDPNFALDRIPDDAKQYQLRPLFKDPEAVADLNKRGVRGLKYWDQFSRKDGEGTKNLVVFDPTIIEIVRKYGLAGAVAAGLISQEMAQQMQAQGMGEL